MILDKQLQFSDAQAVTATAVSTNQVDTHADATLKNIGGQDALYLVIQTDATFATGTSLTAELVSSTASNLGTSPTGHLSTGAIPTASLGANKTVFVAALPYGDYKQYVGVKYTVGGSDFTTGKVTAFLTRTPQFWRAMEANNPSATN